MSGSGGGSPRAAAAGKDRYYVARNFDVEPIFETQESQQIIHAGTGEIACNGCLVDAADAQIDAARPRDISQQLSQRTTDPM